ncbi:helix-turn-helix domain-containing protein [Peribacillus asahii]|uniref:helix-turn-helix domain-containing protein n=1 Tax=Peribacillus asahii TaxID=228899 RepID=UPI00207B09EF|nr:helix-turn-helix domain-containing protein [Peribacillus asahii]USK62416.1 winged helix-turn-helix domain-containing protein [Peribacillus asahii]
MKALQVTKTHGLTTDDLRQMEKRTKEARDRTRLTAVRLVMEGYKAIDVAALLNIYRQSVSTYVKNFEEGGISKLLHRKTPSGRVPYLSKEEQNEIKQTILTKTPQELGVGLESHWNTKVIQYYLFKQFGVWMTREGIRVMLHRLELRYTYPTYVLKKVEY